MSILQWNIRGFRANYHHLRILLADCAPACICLQETMLGDCRAEPPRGFRMFTGGVHPGGGHSWGVAILVQESYPHTRHVLRTTLPAVAIRLHLDRLYTVCCLYLPPNETISRDALEDLLQQLPRPFFLLGDFNARHTCWGDTSVNARGRLIESLLLNSRVDILNDGKPTHFHFQTNTLSHVDLSIISSDIAGRFLWQIGRDLYNSDHFPILLKHINVPRFQQCFPRYIIDKADWTLFTSLAVTGRDVDDFEDISSTVEYLTSVLLKAADASIPVSGVGIKVKRVPWWTREIAKAWRDKRRQFNRYRSTRLLQDKIRFNRARAYCRFLIKQSRRQSWSDYVSTISHKTSLTEIWKKVHKINGKYKPPPSPVLRTAAGELLSDPGQVANELAAFLSDASRGS